MPITVGSRRAFHVSFCLGVSHGLNSGQMFQIAMVLILVNVSDCLNSGKMFQIEGRRVGFDMSRTIEFAA